MKYEIKKAVSYVIFDEDGVIIGEFADYEEAYRWTQEMEQKGGEADEG